MNKDLQADKILQGALKALIETTGLSISAQYFPPFSAQYFPLFQPADACLCAV